MTKKILYIHNTYPNSEKANLLQVVHMCNAMSVNGHKVTLALPYNILNYKKISCKYELKKNLGIDIKFDIIEYKKITPFNKLKFIGGLIGINSIFKNDKYDFCITRHAPYIKFALKHNMPTIYESHHDLVHVSSKTQNKLWTSDLINCSKNTNFKVFLCISEELRKYWRRKGIDKRKLKVLHDGFSEDLFNKQIDINSAKSYLDLPLYKKIVVYVGSLYRDRGIDQILRLASDFQNVIFLIVGGPDKEKNELINTAKLMRLNNVIFKGRVKNSEVPMYLFSADALLMIWTKEVSTIKYCSPLKLFEYMASGRTIVGYGFKTILEVLTNGKDSLLAKPDDVGELKKYLNYSLIEEGASQLGKIARQEALEKYTWSNRARELVSFMS